MAQWRAGNISERAFTLLSEHGRNFQYLDRDALNILLEDKVTFVSSRFNTLTMLAHDDRGYTLDVPAETCLIHYAGADKPAGMESTVCGSPLSRYLSGFTAVHHGV